jgi:tetratricopeptide (TPR) repeat protein
MAFDKAKALQEANKWVTQGKTTRAIKQYEWIVEKDPSDLILLNVIGDLYAQEDRMPEALKYFYRLGEAYAREGYKVKAIAIYKKILKLDRGKVEPILRLAELNLAQGLAREAREQYRNAFEFFERRGQKDNALEILRKLCQLDPTSVRWRLDFAQFAEQAGETREAADAYLEGASLAHQSGDAAAVQSALSRAAELAPENPEVRLLRARQALADQKPEEVKAILDSIPELQSNPQAKRLLLESHMASGNLDAARGLLLEVFHSNPSDFAPVADFVGRCVEKQQYDAALEVLTAAAPPLIARRETASLMEALNKLWKSSPERIDILEFTYQTAEQTADEATIPEVLETLGNAHVQLGQFEKAEQAYARLVAREPENETYKGLLRQVLEKQGKEYVPFSRTPFISSEVGFESVSDAADGGVAAGSPSLPSAQEAGSAQPAGGPEASPTLMEIDLSQPAGGQGLPKAASELPPPQEISLAFQTPPGDEPATGDSGISHVNSPEEPVSPALSQPAPAAKDVPAFNYEESREEIEFYLRHGFYNEADNAVSELEKNYPGEDGVAEFRLRVNQLTRQGNSSENPQMAPETDGQETEQVERELPTSFFGTGETDDSVEETPMSAEPGITGGGDDGLEDMAGELGATLEGVRSSEMAPAASAGQVGPDAAPKSVADASAELGSLLEELDDTNDLIDQTADDEQTHYNLGVAFREMGLLDEAIGEFQKVVKETGPKQFGPYFLQGCSLLASCFMDKGMPAIAAKWYLRATDAPDLDHEGKLALYYDLGIALEKGGDTTAALEKFTEVYSQNIDYRDVAEKIRLLRQASR